MNRILFLVLLAISNVFSIVYPCQSVALIVPTGYGSANVRTKNHNVVFQVTAPTNYLIVSVQAIVVPANVVIPVNAAKWPALNGMFANKTFSASGRPSVFNLRLPILSAFNFNFNNPYNLGLLITLNSNNKPPVAAISNNFFLTSCDQICDTNACGDYCDISANIGYYSATNPAVKITPDQCVCSQVLGDSPESFRTCPWHKLILSTVSEVKSTGQVVSTVSSFPYLEWADAFTNVEGQQVNQLNGYIKVGANKVGFQLTLSISNQVIQSCVTIGDSCNGYYPNLGNNNLTVSFTVRTKDTFLNFIEELEYLLSKLNFPSESNGFHSEVNVNQCVYSENGFPIAFTIDSLFPFIYTVRFSSSNKATDGSYSHCSNIQLNGGQTFFDDTDSALIEDTENSATSITVSFLLFALVFLLF